MPVREYYHDAIHSIMSDNKIPRVERGWKPNYIIPQDAGFEWVVQYTEYYIGYQTREERFRRPGNRHFRYDEYRGILNTVKAGGSRHIHVDIGCGAGVFSWAFLDWAEDQGINYDHLALYGYDHSQAMIQLAGEIRNRIVQHIPNYPALQYSSNVDAFLRQLTENLHGDISCIITLGHVLVQAQALEAIQIFTRIIQHLMNLPNSAFVLIAVDAWGEQGAFTQGWNLLLCNLAQYGIKHDRDHSVKGAFRTFLIPPQL